MTFQDVQSTALHVWGNVQLVTSTQPEIHALLPLRLLSEIQTFQKSF